MNRTSIPGCDTRPEGVDPGVGPHKHTRDRPLLRTKEPDFKSPKFASNKKARHPLFFHVPISSCLSGCVLHPILPHITFPILQVGGVLFVAAFCSCFCGELSLVLVATIKKCSHRALWCLGKSGVEGGTLKIGEFQYEIGQVYLPYFGTDWKVLVGVPGSSLGGRVRSSYPACSRSIQHAPRAFVVFLLCPGSIRGLPPAGVMGEGGTHSRKWPSAQGARDTKYLPRFDASSH